MDGLLSRERSGPDLIVDVDGFEGPLDLLLSLARTQKLDLAKISILALAEQYLAFVDAARRLRLDLAADYLVMAAWLAFLKSKLLIPEKDDAEGEPTGAELAAFLAHRLQRLEAMREAAKTLMERKQLNIDVFPRGYPEGVRIHRTSRYEANVYDLLQAYAQQRQRTAVTTVKFAKRPVWSIKEARSRLEKMLGLQVEWAPLNKYLSQYLGDPEMRRTALASAFGASLEMAREGLVEIRQGEAFAPLYVRCRRSERSD